MNRKIGELVGRLVRSDPSRLANEVRTWLYQSFWRGKISAFVEGSGELSSQSDRVQFLNMLLFNGLVEEDNSAFYEAVRLLNKTPVPIEEFVQSPEFLGGQIEIWPSLMPDLQRMNPDVLVGEEPVHEALLGGATGTGKTTLATVTTLYQIYLLTCFDEPQRAVTTGQAAVCYRGEQLICGGWISNTHPRTDQRTV